MTGRSTAGPSQLENGVAPWLGSQRVVELPFLPLLPLAPQLPLAPFLRFLITDQQSTTRSRDGVTWTQTGWPHSDPGARRTMVRWWPDAVGQQWSTAWRTAEHGFSPCSQLPCPAMCCGAWTAGKPGEFFYCEAFGEAAPPESMVTLGMQAARSSQRESGLERRKWKWSFRTRGTDGGWGGWERVGRLPWRARRPGLQARRCTCQAPRQARRVGRRARRTWRPCSVFSGSVVVDHWSLALLRISTSTPTASGNVFRLGAQSRSIVTWKFGEWLFCLFPCPSCPMSRNSARCIAACRCWLALGASSTSILYPLPSAFSHHPYARPTPCLTLALSQQSQRGSVPGRHLEHAHFTATHTMDPPWQANEERLRTCCKGPNMFEFTKELCFCPCCPHIPGRDPPLTLARGWPRGQYQAPAPPEVLFLSRGWRLASQKSKHEKKQPGGAGAARFVAFHGTWRVDQ